MQTRDNGGMRYEVILEGALLGEGPVWCPDGTLITTHMGRDKIRRTNPKTGRSEMIASFAGGANSAQLASDGGLVITNNGGIDFAKLASMMNLDPAKITYEPGKPGLQRMFPDGRVTYLADAGLSAPNDLIVARDGTLYFTDPPPNGGIGAQGKPGRVWSWTPTGGLKLVARDFQYCNGIALSPEERLLIVEANGLLWIDPASGEREWFIERLGGERSVGDGFKFDAEGRIYCAAPMDHAILIFDKTGKKLDQIDLGAGAMVTNCCFGGSDGRTLFTVELTPGRICAIEGLPAPGLPLRPWPIPV
jgi:gluconolactonase